MKSARRSATIIAAAALITQLLAPSFSFAAEGENIDLRPLRAAAMIAGNLGTTLWAYDFQNANVDEVKLRASALREEAREFEARERQRSLDQFGDFVDPLPGMKAVLLKKAFSTLATNGKLEGLLNETGIKNIVVKFDVEMVARTVREGPVLASAYGHFMGQTTDGNGFGVLAPPEVTAVYLMTGQTITKEASVKNNIATFTFDELDRVIADGGGTIAVLHERDANAPTYAIPGSIAKAEGLGEVRDIESAVATLKGHRDGIAGIANLLAQNGRTCVALGVAVAAISSKSFLAQLSQIFEQWIDAIVQFFSSRASAAGETATSYFCAGVDETGSVAAPILRIGGEGFSAQSVMRVDGVDQETTVANGILIASAPAAFATNSGGSIDVVSYPEFALVVSGAGFNPGAIIRINGEDVATVETADKTLSAVVPAKFRGKNPALLTVYNPISQKESSPATETWVPPKDKPLSPELKVRVKAAAMAVGLQLDAVDPSDIGRAYQYYYSLWKAVIGQMK